MQVMEEEERIEELRAVWKKLEALGAGLSLSATRPEVGFLYGITALSMPRVDLIFVFVRSNPGESQAMPALQRLTRRTN